MLNVGAASRVINPEVGAWVQGASVDNKAESIRDDLEINGLYLADGDTQVLLVSVDVAALMIEFVAPARKSMAEAAGLPERNIIIATTHQHSGPVVTPTHPLKPRNEAFHAMLHERLVDLAAEAVQAAQPARIGWGVGETRVGYNRRCCWADGSHSMHGDTTRDDFTGLEGPDDPQHTVLFARDAEDNTLAVLHHNTTHPTTFYGSSFYSADFPGAARAYLRETLGDIPVLFFNGAQGDIASVSQTARPHDNEDRERRMMRSAHLLTGETLRLLHESPVHDDVPLAHAFEDLRVDVRLPAPDRIEWARGIMQRAEAGDADLKRWDHMFANGILMLQEKFGDDPADTLPVHAVRIGDLAFATEPCELYCQFGLDIKRRSPAPITAVIGLADGCNGYCPTVYGILGGGYSGEPILWTRLEIDAGYRIVDTASKLLHRVHNDE